MTLLTLLRRLLKEGKEEEITMCASAYVGGGGVGGWGN